MKQKIAIIFISFLFFTKSSAEPKIQAPTAILMDYNSGKILFERDADHQIYPASMTKIMTAIIVFDLLKQEKIKLSDEVIISENAWRMSKSGYSSMFIMLNDKVSIEDLLRGIIVVSGNDACVALAEGIAGTETAFADMMNEKAEEIGLINTNFTNSSGINDPDNYSTVRDILKMSRYLIKEHPEFYKMFAEKEFTWDRTGGDPITQGNRNPLLYKNFGADGIKTGYLAVEKYSLASSINRNGRRLIAVASGFNTKNSRSKESTKLLTFGLTNYDLIEIAKANQSFHKIDVWLGKESNVQAYLNRFSELVFDGVINSDWVEGVLEILSELDKSILITATPQDEIERIIEKIEIGKFFKKVYGSPKTKIECVEDFIESKDINLNSCLFIGDSKSDLQCANHFDMKFLFIKNEYNKHVIVDEDIPQVENFL